MEKISILTDVRKIVRKDDDMTERGKLIQDHFDELMDEILMEYVSKNSLFCPNYA